ncbi:MAG: CocE/NonD family hydrolase [Anaerolineales bacterium]|nr:CocE/NonD family hydrolase [Anaerolineales bacterium]
MTKIKTHFPRQVREITNTWIPLSDGVKLGARIWLPEDAEQAPVPAILEYIPYRKDDGTAQRDALMQPYFAGHGYAAVRVDMRGSGDSDGILYDEYLPQEQDDALEIIAWIAAQPWCTGAVGMIGISWGGFNGLQVAARRPPQLKAVITVDSTDDRYADDVHYMGGCVLGIEMLEWSATMLLHNAKPPDPAHVGERWREMWFERLEKTPPHVISWLTHQRRDAYWQHGSVCEDYAAIECPVYAVGGWADGYTNAVFRLVENLPGPRKGLIGPWAHAYPHWAYPGPEIGFLQECLRWWDYWLKGIDTGIMDEPMLRVWMQESLPPSADQPLWPGRWVAEPAWPSANVEPETYYLAPGALRKEAAGEARLEIIGSLAAGLNAGMWCPYGLPGELPPDQRPDDAYSLSFDSPPLAEGVEILGFPEVSLSVSVDRPNALLAVRLCDVAPSGASTLVSRGLLNLTHRQGHAHPQALQPGKRYTVTVRLNSIAYSMPAGHCWRVAVSPTYWPHAWPSPETATLSVYTGQDSRLLLPARPPRSQDADLAPFEEPETAPPMAVEPLRCAPREWKVHRDVVAGVYQIIDRFDMGLRRFVHNDTVYGGCYQDIYTITEGEPLSARVDSERTVILQRGEWRVRVETRSSMTSTATHFFVTNHVDAFEADTRVFSRSTDHVFPRDLV